MSSAANPYSYAKTGASAPPPDVNQQWLAMQQVSDKPVPAQHAEVAGMKRSREG